MSPAYFEIKIEILERDIWCVKGDLGKTVEVVSQNDRSVTYRWRSANAEETSSRSVFLSRFELHHRTSKWHPADEGKPR